MITGITRIAISDKQNGDARRISLGETLKPAANNIYQAVLPLANELVRTIDCQLGSRVADRDTVDGIDLWVALADGRTYSVQEKLLGQPYKTATFTTINKNGTRGLWYTCRADIWFVAYGRRTNAMDYSIQDWMMIELGKLRACAQRHALRWQYNANNTNNETAQFQYLEFCDVPAECIIGSSDTTEII